MRNAFALDRRVPLALVAGLVLQAAVALWWAAEQASHVTFIERRLSAVEVTQHQARGQNAEALVRLARIEERLQTQTSLLAEIRQRVNK